MGNPLLNTVAVILTGVEEVISRSTMTARDEWWRKTFDKDTSPPSRELKRYWVIGINHR